MEFWKAVKQKNPTNSWVFKRPGTYREDSHERTPYGDSSVAKSLYE